MRMHKQMRIYKPLIWLVKVCQFLTWFQSSLKFLKYIFVMGVNRKLDFWWTWKFCCDLSNVISGGKWLFRWDYVFSGGICMPLRTMHLWKCLQLSQQHCVRCDMNNLQLLFPYFSFCTTCDKFMFTCNGISVA